MLWWHDVLVTVVLQCRQQVGGCHCSHLGVLQTATGWGGIISVWICRHYFWFNIFRPAMVENLSVLYIIHNEIFLSNKIPTQYILIRGRFQPKNSDYRHHSFWYYHLQKVDGPPVVQCSTCEGWKVLILEMTPWEILITGEYDSAWGGVAATSMTS